MEIKILKMKLWANKIYLFLGIYFLIKVFSFYFSPDTPLYSANPINTIISSLILIVTCYLLIKKKQLGWLVVMGEIILGGSGGYFAIAGISLRTLLLISSIGIYILQNLRLKEIKFFNSSKLVIFVLLFWVSISAFIGLKNGHALSNVYSDFVPYLYLLYFFPFRNLLKSEKFKSIALQMLIASIVGNAIFILFTFFGFSFEIFALQDNFYHWYRDVAIGKITDFGTGFFRITLDEHLLLIPLALLFVYKIINKKNLLSFSHSILLILYSLTLIVLSINITRIYMVALGAGYLFLFTKKYWKRWIKYGVLTAIIFLVSFSSLNLITTKGQSFGLELLGLRIGSLVTPNIENSSLSRILLLPEIWEKIKENPILGSGLGDSITIFSPVFDREITSWSFDWGYLEIFAEMGVIGLLIYIVTIFYLFLAIKRNVYFSKYYSNIEYKNINYLFVPFLSLLVINVTSPALFHSLGVIFIMVVFANLKNPKFYSNSAGGIVINPENKVAIVSNFDGSFWTLPKGTIEKNESIKETALREIYEETGIENLKILDNFSSYYRMGRFRDKLFVKKMYLFIFHTEVVGELIPIDAQNPEAKWFDIEEIEDALSNKKDKQIFLINKYKLNKWKR